MLKEKNGGNKETSTPSWIMICVSVVMVVIGKPMLQNNDYPMTYLLNEFLCTCLKPP